MSISGWHDDSFTSLTQSLAVIADSLEVTWSRTEVVLSTDSL